VIPSTSTAKGFRAGTHRLITPEQTVERARRLMPVMGITRVANVTGLDTLGVPVVMVCRPNARSLSVAQGKGLTLAAARASGLMESIESYHAEQITLPLKLATYNALRFTHSMVDVARLPRLSSGSYHDTLRLLWIEGRDLIGGAPVWLPFEMVHTDYTLPLPPGSGSFSMSSSGLASGNHLLEAVSHGICELVERDATTLWHCRSEEERRRTRLDLTTVDDPGCRDVLERCERAGVSVAVWEITTEIGVPAFQCAIAESAPDRHRPIGPMGGMGCHPAREIALLRALTEAAQSRVTLIAGSRDDVRHGRPDLAPYLDALRHFHDRLEAPGPKRRFDDAPTRQGETFEDDVGWELERLRASGIAEVIVVDLTRREFGIPVVRVVIPGLETLHDTPGYTPGARARSVLAERGPTHAANGSASPPPR
jgi:ribosomal protein S12 methylthiotransferase accessory factor